MKKLVIIATMFLLSLASTAQAQTKADLYESVAMYATFHSLSGDSSPNPLQVAYTWAADKDMMMFYLKKYERYVNMYRNDRASMASFMQGIHYACSQIPIGSL